MTESLPPFFWQLGEDGDPPERPAGAIGYSGAYHLCVRDGRVVECNGDESHVRFVNASLSQFEESMRVFRSTWYRRANISDATAREMESRLRSELAGIDESAFDDPNAWWSVILEQMGDDLL